VVHCLVAGALGVGASVYHPALHAQTSDDDRLGDLQSLVAKYQAPASQIAAPVVQDLGSTHPVSGTVAGLPATVIAAPHGVSVTRNGVSVTAPHAGVVPSVNVTIAPASASQTLAVGVNVKGAQAHSTTAAASVDVQPLLSGKGGVNTATVSASVVADRQRPVVQANVGSALNAAVNLPSGNGVPVVPDIGAASTAVNALAGKATGGVLGPVNGLLSPVGGAGTGSIIQGSQAPLQINIPPVAAASVNAQPLLSGNGGLNNATVSVNLAADRQRPIAQATIGNTLNAAVNLPATGNGAVLPDPAAVVAAVPAVLSNPTAGVAAPLDNLLGSTGTVSVAPAVQATVNALPLVGTSLGAGGSASLPLGPVVLAAPVVPPPSSTPTGLIVGNGGAVGTTTQLLGPGENSIFNNTNGYVTNGGLQVNSANFTQGYATVNALGLPVANLTPAGSLLTTTSGTPLGGTGINSHLTLIGAVKSDSYITNINNGAPGGVLGLALPSSAPAWASTCLNVLGVVKESCWAVNAAQDYQVLMGDGATANGSKEVVIGTNATHTLASVNASTAFPGNGVNDPNNPTGVPTADYQARLGHSVVIGDNASGTANAQTIIGAEATASAANSVALGYKTVASRGAQTSYTAFALVAPQTSSGEVSVGAAGSERQITNVAAGSALTDAVNVAQLQAVASLSTDAVVYDTSAHAGVTLGGVASTDGGLTNGTLISNLHQGLLSATSTQAVNGSQLWQWTQNTGNVYSNYSLYTAIQNLSKTTSPGGGGPGTPPGGGTGGSTSTSTVKYFNANSTLNDSVAGGTNSISVGPVAGAAGTDAIAVGHGANASANNAVAIGAGSVADRTNSVSVGSAGNERQITNVATATTATDAVNLGQMQSAVTASQQGAVRYDSRADGSVDYTSATLGNGNNGTTIHNVANGVATTDAANVGQVNAGMQQATNWANAYTDQRVGQLDGKIQDFGHRADAGVAAGMAMAGLPQAYEPGKSMAAVSAGSFRGESSIAIGISTIAQGGRWVFKLAGSADTRGDAGVSVGAGMQW